MMLYTDAEKGFPLCYSKNVRKIFFFPRETKKKAIFQNILSDYILAHSSDFGICLLSDISAYFVIRFHPSSSE